MRLTFQQLKVQLQKLKNILRMDSSDEEVLLQSFCLLVIKTSKSKQKKNGRGFGKRIEQGVYHNLLQEIGVND